jgi:hypothetical protein
MGDWTPTDTGLLLTTYRSGSHLTSDIQIERKIAVKEYELVWEIFNECANNQMRDVFFKEIQTDDPEAYVRSCCKEKDVEITREDLSDGSIIFHVNAAGLLQRYSFTEV